MELIIPTKNISQQVKQVIAISNQDCQLLATKGIDIEYDLWYLNFEDIPMGIPVVKSRSINIISKYLSLGHVFNGTMDMQSIQSTIMQG